MVDIRRTIPRHTTRKWKTRNEVDTIIVHTSASDNQDPNKTARYHVTSGPQNHLSKRGAPSISYHDFVAKDGTVYHCNSYTDITWHTKGWNNRGVGVALAFKGQLGHPPDSVQFRALKEHLVVLCLYMKILPKDIRGHREGPGMILGVLGKGSKKYKKSCPGWGINLDALRDDVTRCLQRRLASEGLYRGKIDGLFGKKSKAALKAFVPNETKHQKVNWKCYK